MMDTGQNLATCEDRRKRPRSPLAAKLLGLEVGEYFLEKVAHRVTLGGLMTRWAARTGRKWKMRRLLRPDGTIRQVRVERVL